MSGSNGTLWRLLDEGDPICLVLYPSFGALEETIETVRLLAPSTWTLARTADVEDAFRNLDVPLLLTPSDEVAAVRRLDGKRDALVERTAPVVLFVLKGGAAEHALAEAPGLASWLRGRVFDPEPEEIDVEQELRKFEQEAGRPPRDWLDAWYRGEIGDTLENNLRYQTALLLEST